MALAVPEMPEEVKKALPWVVGGTVAAIVVGGVVYALIIPPVPAYALTLAVDKTEVGIGETVTASGRLVKDNVGVPGVTVTLVANGVAVATAITNSDGSYSIPASFLEAGTYELYTSAMVEEGA